jgi:hypothetical protein
LRVLPDVLLHEVECGVDDELRFRLLRHLLLDAATKIILIINTTKKKW